MSHSVFYIPTRLAILVRTRAADPVASIFISFKGLSDLSSIITAWLFSYYTEKVKTLLINQINYRHQFSNRFLNNKNSLNCENQGYEGPD